MMELLEQEIARIEASIDAYHEVDEFVMENSMEAVKKAGCGLEAVEPLLQLFERHPTAWFGNPGAIVHFIEQFGTEYETYLIASLKRMPSTTTVWMLNRCINAKEQKEELLGLMKEIAGRADIDPEVRERAQEYVEFQNKHCF